MSRPTVPPKTQAQVLTASRRRCAICFGLERDFEVKKGQIAHLDTDPTTPAPDNLIFLCFEHHEEYDSTTRQSKNLTRLEVATYREELMEYLARRLEAPRPPTTLQVASAEELLGAIGSNRVLEVAPGTFDLGVVEDRYMAHVRWDATHAGRTVTIRGVENLTIKGAGLANTRLVVSPEQAYVLRLEGTRCVSLVDLTLGHIPEGDCTGGVLAASHCTALRIQRCALFGSGTEGLSLSGVVGFSMDNSEVFDCTHGIATIESCRDVRFVGCAFRNNRRYHGFVIRDCQHVELIDTVVQSNVCSADLFDVLSSSGVRFIRGTIVDNACGGLGQIEVDRANVQLILVPMIE